jgi:hypothetical protein
MSVTLFSDLIGIRLYHHRPMQKYVGFLGTYCPQIHCDKTITGSVPGLRTTSLERMTQHAIQAFSHRNRFMYLVTQIFVTLSALQR